MRNKEKDKTMPARSASGKASIYQVKVTLKDSKPPIWRRIQVHSDVTLEKLHYILQTVMGWTDSHLHMFAIGGEHYGPTESDPTGELEMENERRVRLAEVVSGVGARFVYEYDFGDSWEHTLQVEKVLPPEPGARYPVCLAGKRASPPEDVGGVWGYTEFLEAIRNPEHPEHDDWLEWVGGDFDPEAVNLEDLNQELGSLR
jgi:hypothetical protein